MCISFSAVRRSAQEFRFAFVALIFASFFGEAALAKTPTAILVDKKTNNLHVCEYDSGAYKILKTYHATLGQVKGDKLEEGDLKTPEGIYTFRSRRDAPHIQKKLGAMAFDMNFPNTFDELAGHSGSNIMLHATDEPERLKRSYDSLGCVVVKNEEIQEIQPRIRLGLTPILIFDELTDEYLKPGQDQALKGFFAAWIKAWEGKDIESYIAHYHSDFKDRGMNRDQWKAFKSGLNSRYSMIEIGPENVMYYRHPKYSMITFTQNYKSKLKAGGWGHRSRGTKILYVAEEAGKPKIIAETYTNLMW